MSMFGTMSLRATPLPPASAWTLIEEWDSREGHLANLVTNYGTDFSIDDFAWSPDGVYLTICNGANTEENIKTFECSTPFDPSTASTTEDGSRSVTNAGWFHWILDGNSWLCIVGTGDDIVRYDASSPYVVSSSATSHSTVSKADVGITGSQDSPFTTNKNGDFLYWGGLNRVIYVPLTNVDLDNPGTPTVNTSPPEDDAGGYTLTNNNDRSWYAISTGGDVQLWSLTSEGDVGSLAVSTAFDVGALLTYVWTPVHIWMDPDDLRYVWIGGDTAGSHAQLARFATNI